MTDSKPAAVSPSPECLPGPLGRARGLPSGAQVHARPSLQLLHKPRCHQTRSRCSQGCSGSLSWSLGGHPVEEERAAGPGTAPACLPVESKDLSFTPSGSVLQNVARKER